MGAITSSLHGSVDISELLNKGSLGTDSINNAKARVLDVLLEGGEVKFGGHAVKIVPSSLEARMILMAAFKTATESAAASSAADRPVTASSLVKAAKSVKEDSPEFQKHLEESRKSVEKGFKLFVESQDTYEKAQASQHPLPINMVLQGTTQLNRNSTQDETTKVVTPLPDNSKNGTRTLGGQVTKKNEEQRAVERQRDIAVEKTSRDKEEEFQKKQVEKQAAKTRAIQKEATETSAA